MNERLYERISAPLRRHPGATRAVILCNKALTYLGYAIYPLLLVILLVTQDPFLPWAFLVPAVMFGAVTVFRKAYNRPRPYEALAIDPLIRKDTQGKSFPSRHAFSMAMIAVTWLAWCPPVGIALLVATIAMGYVRVAGGVHYPIDVIAGIAIALVAGMAYWLPVCC